MDQLHEELKEVLPEPYDQSSGIAVDDSPEEDNHSQSDDFQSCESCGSSERADNEVQGGNMLIDDTNEAELLIPEQDEIQANREWQKEKNMINDMYRSGVNGVMGGSTGVDVDKDVDTTSETTPIISSQGAIKVQGRTSGKGGEAEACPLLFCLIIDITCVVSKPLNYLTFSPPDSFPDIQISNNTRPQSPVLMEGHIPKMSSSPPKAASAWPSLNPSHKKGTPPIPPKLSMLMSRKALFSQYSPPPHSCHHFLPTKEQASEEIPQRHLRCVRWDYCQLRPVPYLRSGEHVPLCRPLLRATGFFSGCPCIRGAHIFLACELLLRSPNTADAIDQWIAIDVLGTPLPTYRCFL